MVVEHNTHQPVEPTARAISAAYQIEHDDEALSHISDVLARSYRFSEGALDAENNYLLNRLSIAGDLSRSQDGRHTAEGEIAFGVVRHYLEPVLPSATDISHNIRIRNTGTSMLRKASSTGHWLAGHWLYAEGGVCETAGLPFPIPTNMPPGREITIPYPFHTPQRPGSYRLSLTLTNSDGAEVCAAASQSIPVQVRRQVSADGPFIRIGQPIPSYDDDHREAIRIVDGKVKELGCRWGLELGGCSTPMTTNMPCEIVSIDIDAQTLQMGRFVFARRGHANVRFACCDAHEIPFPTASFDFVAIFAALHHMRDPVETLRSAARVVKDDGFIAVMCEPVGHYREPDAEMQQELDNGINEQRFSLVEYLRMFHQAGLRVEYAQTNGDSLKAILVKRNIAERLQSLLGVIGAYMMRLCRFDQS